MPETQICPQIFAHRKQQQQQQNIKIPEFYIVIKEAS